MRVARLYRLDDVRVEDAPVPEIGPGEALVRTRACGICTGDIMAWYIERKAPLVFGHEPAGEVVAVGEGVEALSPGDRVFVHHHAPCGECSKCRRGLYVHCPTWRSTALRPGGMAEYFAVPADNLARDTLRLPDGVDFEAASLVEPTACVVKSLRRGAVAAGETVAVIGLGVMGQLHVVLARHAGARVVAFDRVPFRLERALRLGAEAAIDVDANDPAASLSERTGGDMADVVIVGPGSIEAMELGIRLAGSGGRVVLFTTSQPDETLAVSPFRLYFDEVSLVPSYSCGPDDTREALELIAAGIVRPQDVVTHRFPLERVAEAVAQAQRPDEALKTIVVFD
ncbi:MAG: sorbitol dehydrogenase [Deltaproteobacteria bacterium]|nr:MAG: sorbitol dehydrogenase [Deltaproteobacteria bacterium]